MLETNRHIVDRPYLADSETNELNLTGFEIEELETRLEMATCSNQCIDHAWDGECLSWREVCVG